MADEERLIVLCGSRMLFLEVVPKFGFVRWFSIVVSKCSSAA